jgi:hypothetical protein
MIEQTQKLMKEIEILSNDNLMLRASERELERKQEKLKRAFNDLLNEYLELKDQLGHGDFREENQYHWVDKAGLLDTL